jgi:hypothetical protein
LPIVEAHEAVAENEDGADVVFADLIDGFLRPFYDFVGVEFDHAGFVDETIHGYDVFVARLREEDGEFVVDIEPTLGVFLAVGAIEPAHGALASGMVPAVLRPWGTVKIEVDAEAVLARVFDAAKEVAPAYLRDVDVVVVGLDHPVAEGNADVVEACVADGGETLFGDESCVVFFEDFFTLRS